MPRVSSLKSVPKSNGTTTLERLSVVETKVEALDEKIDDVRYDIKEVYDTLDKHSSGLREQLIRMQMQSTEQHETIAEEVSKLKAEKDKIVWTVAGGLIVASWITAHFDFIKSLF